MPKRTNILSIQSKLLIPPILIILYVISALYFFLQEYQLLDTQAILSIAGLGLSAVAMILFYVWFTKTTLMNLAQLSSQTQKMAAGNLEERLAIRTHDEIGSAAANINTLVERLGTREKELALEKSTVEDIINAAPQGIIYTDLNFKIRYSNPQAEDMLGFSTDKSKGTQLLKHLELIGGAHTPKGLEQHRSDHAISVPGTDKNYNYLVSSSIVLGLEKTPIGIVSIIRDITKETEAESSQLTSLNNLAHELRTPLTSLIGYLEILRKGNAGTMRPKQEEMIGIALENADSLKEQIDILLKQRQSVSS